MGTQKVHTSKTRKSTVKIAVSGFSRYPLTYILTHSEPHNGLTRARNANFSVLVSDTMWYQPILIQLLTVLFLLQQHIHFSSSSRVSMRTLGCSRNVIDDDIRNTWLFEKFIPTFRKVHSSNCLWNLQIRPKIVCPLGTEIWSTGPKIKK